MNKKEVEVLCVWNLTDQERADLRTEIPSLWDYDNKILKDGKLKVKDKWYEIPSHAREKKYKWELSNIEQRALSMFKDNTKKAKELYDSAKRKESNFIDEIFRNEKDLPKNLYMGDNWECELSPINRCLYEYNDNQYNCVFCGEPEERK